MIQSHQTLKHTRRGLQRAKGARKRSTRGLVRMMRASAIEIELEENAWLVAAGGVPNQPGQSSSPLGATVAFSAEEYIQHQAEVKSYYAEFGVTLRLEPPVWQLSIAIEHDSMRISSKDDQLRQVPMQGEEVCKISAISFHQQKLTSLEPSHADADIAAANRAGCFMRLTLQTVKSASIANSEAASALDEQQEQLCVVDVYPAIGGAKFMTMLELPAQPGEELLEQQQQQEVSSSPDPQQVAEEAAEELGALIVAPPSPVAVAAATAGASGGAAKRRPRVNSHDCDYEYGALESPPVLSITVTGTKKPRGPPSSKAGVPETMLTNKQKLKVDWNDHFCHECLNQRDGTAVECDGTCLRMWHVQCLPQELRPRPDDPADAPWYCGDCRRGRAECAVCGEQGTAGADVYKCNMGSCGRYYHPTCLLHLRQCNYKFKVAPTSDLVRQLKAQAIMAGKLMTVNIRNSSRAAAGELHSSPAEDSVTAGDGGDHAAWQSTAVDGDSSTAVLGSGRGRGRGRGRRGRGRGRPPLMSVQLQQQQPDEEEAVAADGDAVDVAGSSGAWMSVSSRGRGRGRGKGRVGRGRGRGRRSSDTAAVAAASEDMQDIPQGLAPAAAAAEVSVSNPVAPAAAESLQDRQQEAPANPSSPGEPRPLDPKKQKSRHWQGPYLTASAAAGVPDDVPFTAAEVLQGRVCCPSHYCHSCHLSGDSLKLLRCWTCPRAYHASCLHDLATKLDVGGYKMVQCPWCTVAHRHAEQQLQLQQQQQESQAQGDQNTAAAVGDGPADAQKHSLQQNCSSSLIHRKQLPDWWNARHLLAASRSALVDPDSIDLSELTGQAAVMRINMAVAKPVAPKQPHSKTGRGSHGRDTSKAAAGVVKLADAPTVKDEPAAAADASNSSRKGRPARNSAAAAAVFLSQAADVLLDDDLAGSDDEGDGLAAGITAEAATAVADCTGDTGVSSSSSRQGRYVRIVPLFESAAGAAAHRATAGMAPNTPVDLVGKRHWHFGTHYKGGGVEFQVPVAGVKLHSKLVVHEDGVVSLRPMHHHRRVTPPLLNNTALVGKGVCYELNHGDVVDIGGARFRVEWHKLPEGAAATALATNPAVMVKQAVDADAGLAAAAAPPPAAAAAAGWAHSDVGDRVEMLNASPVAAAAAVNVGKCDLRVEIVDDGDVIDSPVTLAKRSAAAIEHELALLLGREAKIQKLNSGDVGDAAVAVAAAGDKEDYMDTEVADTMAVTAAAAATEVTAAAAAAVHGIKVELVAADVHDAAGQLMFLEGQQTIHKSDDVGGGAHKVSTAAAAGGEQQVDEAQQPQQQQQQPGLAAGLTNGLPAPAALCADAGQALHKLASAAEQQQQQQQQPAGVGTFRPAHRSRKQKHVMASVVDPLLPAATAAEPAVFRSPAVRGRKRQRRGGSTRTTTTTAATTAAVIDGDVGADAAAAPEMQEAAAETGTNMQEPGAASPRPSPAAAAAVQAVRRTKRKVKPSAIIKDFELGRLHISANSLAQGHEADGEDDSSSADEDDDSAAAAAAAAVDLPVWGGTASRDHRNVYPAAAAAAARAALRAAGVPTASNTRKRVKCRIPQQQQQQQQQSDNEDHGWPAPAARKPVLASSATAATGTAAGGGSNLAIADIPLELIAGMMQRPELQQVLIALLKKGQQQVVEPPPPPPPAAAAAPAVSATAALEDLRDQLQQAVELLKTQQQQQQQQQHQQQQQQDLSSLPEQLIQALHTAAAAKEDTGKTWDQIKHGLSPLQQQLMEQFNLQHFTANRLHQLAVAVAAQLAKRQQAAEGSAAVASPTSSSRAGSLDSVGLATLAAAFGQGHHNKQQHQQYNHGPPPPPAAAAASHLSASGYDAAAGSSGPRSTDSLRSEVRFSGLWGNPPRAQPSSAAAAPSSPPAPAAASTVSQAHSTTSSLLEQLLRQMAGKRPPKL